MSQLRGIREIVCQACGAAWSGRDARFCGHCGAALDDLAAPEGAADDRSPDRRSKSWILGLLAVGVVVTVASVIGVGGAPAWLESDPRAEMSTDVELPEPEDVTDTDAGDVPDPDPQDGGFERPGGQLACEPEGCELWQIDRPMGTFAVLGSVVIHVATSQRSGGSSLGQGASDEDQPSAEAVVTAYSAESGQDLWTVVIEERLDTLSGQTSWELTVVDEDLVLVGLQGTTFALDPNSGTLRWSVAFEHEVAEAARGGVGEVILWGPAAPDEVEEAVPAEEVSEAPSEGSVLGSQTIQLTAVDPGSGQTLWTDRGRWVMGLDDDYLLLLDEHQERVAALDLSTGERLWERDTDGHVDPRPVSISGGRVVLVEGAQVDILDISTGEPYGSRELDFEPNGMTTIVGDMVLVTEDGQGSRPGPTGAEVHDLFDLDAEPRRFDDLVGSVVLREGGAASHWDWARSTAEGLILLTQHGDVARLEALDPDGTSRWQTRVPLAGADCCVRLHDGRDTSTVIVVPPEDGEGVPQIISTETGAVVGFYDVAMSDLDEPAMWFGGMAVYGLVGEGEREVVLAGPAGEVRVSGGWAFPLSRAPIPILQGERGILAIDPNRLFADEAEDAGG